MWRNVTREAVIEPGPRCRIRRASVRLERRHTIFVSRDSPGPAEVTGSGRRQLMATRYVTRAGRCGMLPPDMQRYLVTGAAGNLARQLMDELVSRGKETFGIDLVPAPAGREGNWQQIDITDRASLARLLDEFRPQCILHMASLLSMSSAADPPRAWEVNACAAVALMELAVEHGVQRFFFPSTSATYGGVLPDRLPEDHPQWPDNIYGAAKVAVERVGTYFALSRGLDFRSVRLPIVASPFAPPAAVSAYASHVFAAAARGEPFTFPVASEVAVSVIYVRDVTLGILKLVEVPEEPLTRRVYNLHGFAASAGDLAQAAAQRVPGFRYRFEPAKLPTRILSVQPSVYTDASAHRDWGWHPQFDLPATTDHLLARIAAKVK